MAVIVKLKVPPVVGVPEMTAVVPLVGFRFRPGGSAPLETVKVYGGVPPLAVIVWLYGTPRTGVGSVAGLTVMNGQPGTTGITMEYVRLPGQLLASVAVIVKVYWPDVVGVPEMTPVVVLSVRPGGSVPLVSAKVYGAVPPVAETVWL